MLGCCFQCRDRLRGNKRQRTRVCGVNDTRYDDGFVNIIVNWTVAERGQNGRDRNSDIHRRRRQANRIPYRYILSNGEEEDEELSKVFALETSSQSLSSVWLCVYNIIISLVVSRTSTIYQCLLCHIPNSSGRSQEKRLQFIAGCHFAQLLLILLGLQIDGCTAERYYLESGLFLWSQLDDFNMQTLVVVQILQIYHTGSALVQGFQLLTGKS